jgi:hypothetical protein
MAVAGAWKRIGQVAGLGHHSGYRPRDDRGGWEAINAASYLCFGVPLFLAWLAVVGLYDRLHYVIFSQGQIRYVLEVGDSEVVMPAGGAIVEKNRSDAFRHRVLGLGPGT